MFPNSVMSDQTKLSLIRRRASSMVSLQPAKKEEDTSLMGVISGQIKQKIREQESLAIL